MTATEGATSPRMNWGTLLTLLLFIGHADAASPVTQLDATPTVTPISSPAPSAIPSWSVPHDLSRATTSSPTFSETVRQDPLVVLTFLTVVVYAVQAVLMYKAFTANRDAARASSIAAKAAQDTAQAAQAAERPWLVVVPDRVPRPTLTQKGETASLVQFSYSVKNFGRSLAFIIENRCTATVVSFPEIEDNLPVPDLVTSWGPISMPIPPMEQGLPYNVVRQLDAATRERILRGQAGVLLRGEIHYRDTFAVNHVHAFSWVYLRARRSGPPEQYFDWGNVTDPDEWASEWMIQQGPEVYSLKTT